MKKRIAAALAAMLLLAGCGAGKQDEPHRSQLFAMDTVMSLTAYGPNGEAALAAAAAEINRLDALWSVGRAESEVSRLNAAGELELSAETAALLERALWYHADTGGCFEPTVFPLMELWGFTTGNYRVPSQEELDALLPAVDASQITLEGGRAVLGPGQAIDLGGIAKGWTSARVMEIFAAHGVQSGMVSLGGNIQTLGDKPDGTAWRVGIRDPLADGADSYFAVLSVSGKAVVTSGGYERFFEQDGQTYIHILDPATGRPVRSDLLSVTVVSADGVAADALSTALYVMGGEAAAAYWRARAELFDLVLVFADGRVLVSEGAADAFECERPFSVLSHTA